MDTVRDTERKKYERVWGGLDSYRDQADGYSMVETAFVRLGCQPGDTLIDWGCGKGTPAQKFIQLGLKVKGIDIAHNCLDPDVKIPLVVGCLWDPDLPTHVMSDYAFSTDVLEHIPPEKLDEALYNIYARTTKAAYLQVCTIADTSGPKMSPPEVLHLSVMSDAVWLQKLGRIWERVEQHTVPKKKARVGFFCYKE